MNISEIAKRAGVSNSAVSRYLNDGYLSAEKREAIRRVIEETGYRPLAQAQALRNRKTRTIGVILPKIDSSSTGSVVAGVESVLEEKGFQLLLGDTHNTPEKELAYLETFDHQRVEGVVLIATVLTPRHLTVLRESRLPVVVVGQQAAGVSCVYHDDYHAFYDMTALLVGKGCRRLGYIGALPQDKAAGQARSQAYCDAVRDGGLADQAGHIAIAEFSVDSGREKAQELWTACGPLDALVCATDAMAAGALQFFRSRGIQVPEQVRLSGHGASRLCQVTAPALTTIRYFYRESGVNAAALLLERLADPAAPVKAIQLGYEILENESTL